MRNDASIAERGIMPLNKAKHYRKCFGVEKAEHIQGKEKTFICEICQKPFKRVVIREFKYIKTTCSAKCESIRKMVDMIYWGKRDYYRITNKRDIREKVRSNEDTETSQ